MSFFTSLTGLNAATTQLSVTSNNIANAGTTGFKRSRSDFGDIFATSPLQKASTVVGQGTALKQVTQEFSQGNIELSGNSLDLAVTGEGFFPLRSADGQDLFTRNGSFLLDEQNTVVNSAGQFLRVASVDSLGKADFQAELVPLTIAPNTVGQAIATSQIGLAINFPAESLPQTTVNEANVETIKPFDQNDPTTYAKSAAVTIFDENGNDFLLTFFYRRVGVASADDPFNKWQTHIVLDGQEITPALGQATATDQTPLYVDKYGNILPEDELPTAVRNNAVFRKYILDDLADPNLSAPAKASGTLVGLPYLTEEAGVNFAPSVASTSISVVEDQLAGIGDTSHTVATTAIASNTITVASHGLSTGDRVLYDAQSGTTATGLIDQAEYYVVRESASTFKLATTYANAVADTPVTVNFSGGNSSQTITYREVVSLTMKDSNNAELATLSTVTAASASIDLVKNGDIEANDRISLKLTDADGTAVNISTSALAADASVADIVDALNRASAATAVNFASIASDTITATAHGYETGDRVKFN
ncbi:MAG: flagellar hook-basal body complex protein, partial [Litorivicinaceae bacterium]